MDQETEPSYLEAYRRDPRAYARQLQEGLPDPEAVPEPEQAPKKRKK